MIIPKGTFYQCNDMLMVVHSDDMKVVRQQFLCGPVADVVVSLAVPVSVSVLLTREERQDTNSLS